MYEIEVKQDEYGCQILAHFSLGTVLIGSAKTETEARMQAEDWINTQKDWAEEKI